MHQQTGGMLMLLASYNMHEKTSKTGVRYYQGSEGYDQCRTTGEIGRQLQRSDREVRHLSKTFRGQLYSQVHLILGQTRAHTHQCWASPSKVPCRPVAASMPALFLQTCA